MTEDAGDGSTKTYGPKSSHALWKTIEQTLSSRVPLGRVSLFVPDGAATFGAAAAESHGGEAVAGHNVASLWDEWRRSEGLEPLELMHCCAHRGALCYKDVVDDFAARWHSLLLRGWKHFQESIDGEEEYLRIQRDMGLDPRSQLCGSHAKWCGFAEAAADDCRRWEAKKIYWEYRVVHTSASHEESKQLAEDSFNFYNSLQNRFLAAGQSPI